MNAAKMQYMLQLCYANDLPEKSAAHLDMV